MVNEKITERFNELDCSDDEKNTLHTYLFSCLGEGKNFRLKRNRVMITEEEDKNKYILLDIVKTSVDNQVSYICPKCFPVFFGEFLSSEIAADQFKSCIHTKLCYIIWGDEYDIEVNVSEDDDDEDLIEILSEKPRYMAVIHPSRKSPKGPGVVVLSSKMLKPKCVVCSGQDCCIHLRIHSEKYELQRDGVSGISNKRIKMDRVEPVKPQKKKNVDPDSFDPFQHEGPACNVFNAKIYFIQTEEMKTKNRRNSNLSFRGRFLISEYNPDEVCERHGNMFEKKENILYRESYHVKIHHIKNVETGDLCVLYRPTVQQNGMAVCECKRFYTGEDKCLLRVSPANYRISERDRVLHFVSHEFYFNRLATLCEGGETMHTFIKSKKFMDEIFFGHDKSPEHKRILHKGFEIFTHALQFPEDANHCYECPEKLGEGEKEDDFKDSIEYSVIDGIQLGCRINDKKSSIEDVYFTEDVENILVKGIEAKDRTYINSHKIRTIIGNLLTNVDSPSALDDTVGALNKMELDSHARSVLEMLNRLSSQHKILPAGYILLLRELHLVTPISALLTPYSSNRDLYERLLSYLNNKTNIFSACNILEEFINNFPVVIECIKNILEVEHSKQKHFLPSDVSSIFKNMITLRFEFDKRSRRVAAPRTKPKPGFVEPIADFFPNYPIHTMENIYKADSKPDPSEEADDCEKKFSETTSILG